MSTAAKFILGCALIGLIAAAAVSMLAHFCGVLIK
jgi:hypothetical protein